jgi:hypothetical protein
MDISPELLLCIGVNDTSAIKNAINELILLLHWSKKAKHGSDDGDINGDGPSTSAAAAATTAVATITNATTINGNKKPQNPTTHAVEDSRSTFLTRLPKDSVPGLLFHIVMGAGRIPGYVGRAQLEQTWPEAVHQQDNTTSNSSNNNNNKKTIAIKVRGII